MEPDARAVLPIDKRAFWACRPTLSRSVHDRLCEILSTHACFKAGGTANALQSASSADPHHHHHHKSSDRRPQNPPRGQSLTKPFDSAHHRKRRPGQALQPQPQQHCPSAAGAHHNRDRGHGWKHQPTGNFDGRSPSTAPRNMARPAIFNNETGEERRIQCDLNKLSQQNYTRIVSRIRFSISLKNLDMVFEKLLAKAYSEPQHNGLYVNMIVELCQNMTAAERSAALQRLDGDINQTLLGLQDSVRFPCTDPAQNYEQFCAVGKMKRDVIGRCETHVSLTRCQALSDGFSHGASDIFEAHAAALASLLTLSLEPDANASRLTNTVLDIETSIETLLECVGIILGKYQDLVTRFKEVVTDTRLARFPSNRCRFKLNDLLEI